MRFVCRLFGHAGGYRAGGVMRGRCIVGLASLALASGADAADLSRALPTKAPPPAAPSSYDWTGFYAGGHLGYAAGVSDWTATPAGGAAPSFSGTLDLFEGYDFFKSKGSYLLGLQAGYNYMLPSRVVLGIEAD